MHALPDYAPPSGQQACVAAGLAPLGVLLVFTLLVTRVIEPDTGWAALAALTVWVVLEMHRYQRAVDGYNAGYVQRHLAWRSPAHLEALVRDDAQPAAARAFVRRYLAHGCQLRSDGPQLS